MAIAISQVKWNNIISNGTNDIDKMFSFFYNELNKIVNKHAPMKILSRRKAKQCAKPWITKGIRTSIKIKNKLYLSGNDDKYKFYRIQKLINNSRAKQLIETKIKCHVHEFYILIKHSSLDSLYKEY